MPVKQSAEPDAREENDKDRPSPRRVDKKGKASWRPDAPGLT